MIKVEDLSYEYPRSKGPVLKDLSFEIERGEIFGFLGPYRRLDSAGRSILFVELGLLALMLFLYLRAGITVIEMSDTWFQIF